MLPLVLCSLICAQVLEPPADGQSYATIVFTNCPPSEADKALLKAIDSDSRLASLKSTTHLFSFCQRDPLWVDRYAPTHDGTSPAIWIQDYTGAVVFKRSGQNLNPATLAADIAAEFQTFSRDTVIEQPAGRKPFFVPDTIRIGPQISAEDVRHVTDWLLVGVAAIVALLFLRSKK